MNDYELQAKRRSREYTSHTHAHMLATVITSQFFFFFYQSSCICYEKVIEPDTTDEKVPAVLVQYVLYVD